ncbi:protoporphyrinogen oxidase [Actinoalloteichus hymeniacidonis]|uniref:Coproporphyrinogen III oxidase n=1 Tax=Actinoalloteichus hymeniacidonis TaxID=340345 RepID=A0AAC9N0H0_9PSEU|nr:protoporphyrinogen oxidase [Actinoalloteichus hymeniacidonis]AOS64906.1 protoporphyrinogen oxidase [Actinoalloteichus hymeniacidonis]MBB5907019.1 oxygen-dependent protoporphyrinogen oxidase [Actinoalloteichus hymeniacidonis]
MTRTTLGPHVAVVGGGVSGLTAAYELRRLLGRSARITVLEQSRRLGGKLATAQFGGGAFDVGAEAFLVRRPEVVQLLTELGATDDLVNPTSAGPTVRAGGRTVALPAAGTVQGVPGSVESVRHVLSPQALARVAGEPDAPPLRLDGGDVSLGEMLRARFGSELTDRLVDPMLGGVYAGSADRLGLRATMPALAKAIEDGDGSVLHAAAGLLPPAPQPGQVRPPVFGTLRGGLIRLIDRLAEAAGATVRLGLPVHALTRGDVGWRLAFGAVPSPELLEVDAVLLAVPPPAARRLLSVAAPAASAAYGAIDVASTVVVSLALPPGSSLPDASGVLIAKGERHDDGTPFTAKAFTFSSRKWEHLGAGRESSAPLLVRGSIGRFGEIETMQRDDEELIASVRADLAELTGIRADPVESLVTRWGGALPQYGVGHVEVVRRIRAEVACLAGLEVAGASFDGIGLAACVGGARSAAAALASGLTSAPSPAEAVRG